ncbi:hypothetical protein RhiirB3_449904 [Rhizophagus irregularis]|nr:hypothetical protein RhiirB3_449904 [Rhizophagus irregularis]
MSIITLSCLVVSENPYENAFAVEIDITKLKVNIFLEEENEKLTAVNTKINVNIKDELGGRPVETKEVHCTAMYGRKSANFQWIVTREMVTLEGFKKKLCEYFTFSDGTKNEHIVIGRVVGGTGLKRKFLTGKMHKKLDQASLSSQSASDTADSYDQLPCIEIGSSATPEEIRNSVIEDFLRMHKASPPITSANEATRCEFISAIIYGVASIFDAKREDINQGVAQSTVQAHASLQCNRKKRTYDDADLYEGAMYCIVSTGVDWVITKVQSGIGDGNDNVGPIEKLFGQIKWFLISKNHHWSMESG